MEGRHSGLSKKYENTHRLIYVIKPLQKDFIYLFLILTAQNDSGAVTQTF